MQRFENLSPEQISDVIFSTNTTLLVSKEIAQTKNYPTGNVPMGMLNIPENTITKILKSSSFSSNDVSTRWATFFLMVSYYKGKIKYNNLANDDCEITIEYETNMLSEIEFPR